MNPIMGVFRFLVKEVSDWSKRRDTLKGIQLEADVAEIKAKAEIATYKVKADIEWDLAWAGQATSSWKDEYILILWTIPLVAFLPSLFFDGFRESTLQTMEFLQGIHPDIFYYYMVGWGVIFSATFGMKGLVQTMIPSKVSKIAEAFSEIPDDIPEAVADKANNRVAEFLKNRFGRD